MERKGKEWNVMECNGMECSVMKCDGIKFLIVMECNGT